MIAITLPDEATAAAISRGLWTLHRPETVGEAETTREFAPRSGAVLLVDPEWALPIHPAVSAQLADPTDAAGSQAALAALLGPLLANPANLATVGGWIAAGGALRIGDLVPLIRPEIVGEPPA